MVSTLCLRDLISWIEAIVSCGMGAGRRQIFGANFTGGDQNAKEGRILSEEKKRLTERGELGRKHTTLEIPEAVNEGKKVRERRGEALEARR